MIQPHDLDLLNDYMSWCGGKSSSPAAPVPAHVFPQWGFPGMVDALSVLPFSMISVLYQGGKIIVHRELPVGTPLHCRAQLIEIEDDGSKIKITTKVITGGSSTDVKTSTQPLKRCPAP